HSPPPAGRGGRRRFLPQRRQALAVAERSRVAGPEGMDYGELTMTNERTILRGLAALAVVTVCALPLHAAKRVVTVQTNSAAHNVHLIDPTTNKIVGTIEGIEANHGAAIAPDGTRIYISNEAMSTLDVVDGKTLKVTKQVPLSGHPNNLASGRDGKRVYVGITEAPG